MMKKYFSLLIIALFFLMIPGRANAQSAPVFVSTFESIGISWKPTGASATNRANVQYRLQNTTTFNNALPLWFDSRNNEYRGSIVNLTSDKTYEIQLTLGSNPSITFTAKTWSENFPIAKTVYLPAGTSSNTITINESGTSNGYILYTHPPGQTSTIDVANNQPANITIDANYVIVRDLILKNAMVDAIQIRPARHDIIIEKNDISGWGRVNSSWGSPYGRDMDAGICFRNSSGSEWDTGNWSIQRVIVQRNKIHHPRYTANSWYTFSNTDRRHPQGPQGISFNRGGGQFVIRYNEISSDLNHRYNDCIGGGENFTDSGFPNKDSDVYGNYLSMCWDDALELEGGNQNIRVWGNYIDRTYNVLGLMTTHLGPAYIWRNISNISIISPRHGDYINDDWFKENRGEFTKAGYAYGYGGGRVYVFHNTMLQPPAAEGMTYPLGVGGGITTYTGLTQYVSRNNIAHVFRPINKSDVCDTLHPCGISVNDGEDSNTSDLDYDLVNGPVSVNTNEETHRIQGSPIYGPNNKSLEFFLTNNSPGFDGGVRIDNFNDDFAGTNPDMGAFESGRLPLEFGVNAYLSISPYPSSTPSSPTRTPTPAAPTPTRTPTPVYKTPTPTPLACSYASSGDFNCDLKINESDLNALLGKWMTNEKDITGDAIVNESDLNKLLGNWKTN